MIKIFSIFCFIFASFLFSNLAFSATQTTFSGFFSDLKLNSRNLDVLYLQKILNSTTSTRIAVTGSGSPGHENKLFSLKVKNAVIRFQKENKITGEVGLVGRKTRNILTEMAYTLRILPNDIPGIIHIFEDDQDRVTAIANYNKNLNK